MYIIKSWKHDLERKKVVDPPSFYVLIWVKVLKTFFMDWKKKKKEKTPRQLHSSYTGKELPDHHILWAVNYNLKTRESDFGLRRNPTGNQAKFNF